MMWSLPEVAIVDEVCATLWERRGKRLRSQLVHLFGEMCGLPDADLALYAWAAEAAHTATLLHDDVIDGARERRGGPSANAAFGNTLPILSGDYLLSDVVQRLSEDGTPELLREMCRAVKALCQGECLQYQHLFRIPEQEEFFLTLSRLKTTALLRWCILVGPSLTGKISREVVEGFADSFGSLFQLADDIGDVTSDLEEGKLNGASFVLIQREPALRRLTERCFHRREISPVLLQAFSLRMENGGMEPVMGELEGRLRQAESWLVRLPRGSQRDCLLERLRACGRGVN